MQTAIEPRYLETPEGREAEAILRACVHCGFCTATCPTYQLLGDELDGPRGRIYLVKQVLEGQTPTRRTQMHLDRCLTCRACETTCPSGVRYGRLADIGRGLVEAQVERPWHERWIRRGLEMVIPHPVRFKPLLRLGQALRPLLPAALARKLPARQSPGDWPPPRHGRRMLAFGGCVQAAATPATNAAAARVLDRLGISLISVRGETCCGAMSHHLARHHDAARFMRRNIDAWWPHVEAGIEAIVITASGCGSVVKEYGELLREDPQYAERAARIAAMTRDLSEVLRDADLSGLGNPGRGRPIAYHSPCSLQHGQRLGGVVEALLQRVGFELTPVADAHLCCGSAGTYSILQPALSSPLLQNKVQALEAGAPTLIATANIGCQLHLATASRLPVRHWIELLEEDGEPAADIRGS